MKIVFIGTPHAAVPTLKRILDDGHDVVAVWTQPDSPSGRGRKLNSPAVKEFALENGIDVHQPTKIKTKESVNLFKSHKADVAIVVAYGRILSKSYLSAFPRGCINVHFSLLPKYRGAAPVNWAIVNGEAKTGITTMQMDLGLDTGRILLQSETAILEGENSVGLMERLSVQGADLLSETLTKYDEITPTKQLDSEATLAPIMSKDDGLIDWKMTAFEISNRVRGFQPFPKSYTSYNGQKLTLWKTQRVQDLKSDRSDCAGEIIEAKGEILLVRCGGTTVLRIDELQMAGKRRMSTRDVLNGTKLEVGEILGRADEV
jgi:methionyl-tRNA formyltransferase